MNCEHLEFHVEDAFQDLNDPSNPFGHRQCYYEALVCDECGEVLNPPYLISNHDNRRKVPEVSPE